MVDALPTCRDNPVARAIREAGGQTAVAKALGIVQGAVWKWVRTGKVPAERVLKLEELSGVSRHELRPDIYPIDQGV